MRFKKSIARLLCLCLCAALLLPAMPLALPAAAQDACGCGRSPVILLPGFSGPQLFLDYGKETERQVWNLAVDGTNTKTLLEGLPELLTKLLAAYNGDKEDVIERAGEIYEQLSEKLAMNEDGSSVYDITAVPVGAHSARWDVMVENDQRQFNNQRALTESLIGEGPDHTTADHVYFFASDWRCGELDNAARLDAFIQEVKADSGHDQVSLLGISYGGLLIATYFTYYGEKGDVERAVLHAPALNGSLLATDLLMNKDFAFDAPSLVQIAMVFFQVESSLDKRVKAFDFSLISEIAVEVMRRYLIPTMLRFGCFWDVIPAEQYETAKAAYLDPIKNAEIIRKSDAVHYEVMPHISQTLQKMQRQGVRIANICGYGLPLGSGSAVSSDYVIGITSTSGAAALPLGKTPSPAAFGDIKKNCKDPAHRHLSPERTVDASSAYLPEHTWFFKGQYHGQAAWDGYACALYRKWLFSNEIKDIYSSPDFPQFRDSCNPYDALEARFSASVSGYLTAQDELLLLKNTSAHPLSILSVEADGLDFDVTFFNPIQVPPGQTIRLRYETMLPKESRVFALNVRFTRESAPPTRETRTFQFSVLPPSHKTPDFLRHSADAAAVNRAPMRIRPAQTLVLLLTLVASLGLAGAAYGLARKRGDGSTDFKKKKRR